MVATIGRGHQLAPIPLRERYSDLHARVNQLAKRMQVQHLDDLPVKIVEFRTTPYTKNSSIYLSPLFLFRVEDIPLQFHVADLNDPRLSNRQFLREFQTWVNNSLRNAGIKSLCRDSDVTALQQALMLMRDPEGFERIKEFAISHELGHIFIKEQSNSHTSKAFLLLVVLALVMIAGGALFVAIGPFALIPLIPLSIGISGCVGYFGMKSMSGGIEEEIRADRMAFELLQDARGGIDYFIVARTQNLMNRAVNHHRIDQLGNYRNSKTHPPLTERIAYLQQWQSERRIASAATA